MARLSVTGQLWNAIGYSQAFHPPLIQTAKWGGVYAVGFLITLVNAALAYAILKRNRNAVSISVLAILLLGVAPIATTAVSGLETGPTEAIVIAIQPNVPMDLIKSTAEMKQLRLRHFQMSEPHFATCRTKGSARNNLA